MKYAGPQQIEIKAHPRFLSFVRLCVDNQEYSLSSDDLRRAIDGVVARPPAQADGEFMESAADLLNRCAEERAPAKCPESTELPPG